MLNIFSYTSWPLKWTFPTGKKVLLLQFYFKPEAFNFFLTQKRHKSELRSEPGAVTQVSQLEKMEDWKVRVRQGYYAQPWSRIERFWLRKWDSKLTNTTKIFRRIMMGELKNQWSWEKEHWNYEGHWYPRENSFSTRIKRPGSRCSNDNI